MDLANPEIHIERVINNGYDIESSKKAIKMRNDKLLPAVGVSPHRVETFREKEIEKLAEHAVAIGEIGMDRYWKKDEATLRAQERVFRAQLSIAEERGLPVIVHSREAVPLCMKILSDYDVVPVYHYFAGSVEEATKIVDEGGYISIPPLRSKKRKKIIKILPEEALLTETDAPYVGKTPDDVVKAVEMIAEAKDMTPEEADRITSKNAKKLFRLSESG